MNYTGVSDKALDERWRRQWPWCRPTNGTGGPESERFREEFLRATFRHGSTAGSYLQTHHGIWDRLGQDGTTGSRLTTY